MTSRFNWRRAAVHALALPVLIIGYIYLTQAPGRSSASLWKAAAPIAGIWILTAIPISYLSQTGRKGASTLLSLVSVAGMFGVAQYFKAKLEDRTLTGDERAALVAVDEGGKPRLRHPALGFSFAHPGPGFVPSVNQAYSADTQLYAFEDLARRARLTVGLFKGQGESTASLHRLIESMRAAIAHDEGANYPGKPSSLTEAQGPLRSVTLSTQFADGRHGELRAYGLDLPGRSPFAVVLMMTTIRPEAYGGLLSSLRP